MNSLDVHGAIHLPRLMATTLVEQLCADLAPFPLDRPGLRLRGVTAVAALLAPEGAWGRPQQP